MASTSVQASTIVAGESTTSSASMTASSTSTGTSTHTVSVGPAQSPHQYVPHTVMANPGDTILFEFMSKNHSITQADYNAPCVPPAQGDFFYSGNYLDSVKLDSSGRLEGDPPTWSLRVNNTKPTFFYCTAIDSCNVNGMVGAINPTDQQTWDTQYRKAMQQPYQLSPGEAPPVEGSESGSSSSSSSGSSGGSHLSGGAIAGIVVGVIAFVVILGLLLFVLGRNRVYKRWMSSEDGRTERTARWALGGGGGGGGVSFGTASWGGNRKSDMEPQMAQMDDTPSTATPMYRPETMHTGMQSPYGNPGSPPLHGHGWSWGQAQQPPARVQQEPFELESNGHSRR